MPWPVLSVVVRDGNLPIPLRHCHGAVPGHSFTDSCWLDTGIHAGHDELLSLARETSCHLFQRGADAPRLTTPRFFRRPPLYHLFRHCQNDLMLFLPPSLSPFPPLPERFHEAARHDLRCIKFSTPSHRSAQPG